jgi:hypothetical protein
LQLTGTWTKPGRNELRTINIIGCGPSAEHWDGKGESLGVNDCEKTGKKVQKLLVVDFPLKFEQERFNIIQRSEAIFYSQLTAWMKYKPTFDMKNVIHFSRWRGRLESGKVNCSLTSPFVAISLAWSLGYQEIILWGVDMNNGKPYHDEEVSNIKSLCACLWKDGCKVLVGAKGGALSFLEVKG